MKYIFVDAYNVINTWPELKKLKEFSLEASRDKLIDKINNYAVYNQYLVYVVFDAHYISSMEKIEKINNNLIVVFTKEHETADSFIEKSVNNLGRRTEISVVTSDNLEQQLIFQRGATRISSSEFYNEIKRTEKNIQVKIQKKYTTRGNRLDESIDDILIMKLEKIRRSN